MGLLYSMLNPSNHCGKISVDNQLVHSKTQPHIRDTYPGYPQLISKDQNVKEVTLSHGYKTCIRALNHKPSTTSTASSITVKMDLEKTRGVGTPR